MESIAENTQVTYQIIPYVIEDNVYKQGKGIAFNPMYVRYEPIANLTYDKVANTIKWDAYTFPDKYIDTMYHVYISESKDVMMAIINHIPILLICRIMMRTRHIMSG